MTALHLDLTPLGCDCTNHLLEVLQKSLADPPDADGLWRPHENRLIRATVEESSRRGQALLTALHAGLRQAITAAFSLHKAAWPLDGFALEQAAANLRGKSPRDYTLDDWLVLVDWMLATQLSPGRIADEAEYLAVRGAMAAELQSDMADGADVTQPHRHAGLAMPATLLLWQQQHPQATPQQVEAIRFAIARSADNITLIGEQARHRIKHHLVEHLKGRSLGEPTATAAHLESKLLGEFATLNRDWRRIAITEAGDAQTQGLIASLEKGSVVKRIEAYTGACGFCAALNGKEFEVTSADNPERDGTRQVWPGKSNVGRSAAPRKRVEGGLLIDREPEERWWPAAGLQHPNAVFAGSTFRSYGELEEMVSADYRGPAVEILAGVHRTTIGPNHPMFTRRGMVRAKDLCEGDELIRDLLHDDALSSFRNPDLEKMEMVEDVFQTIGAVRPHAFIPPSSDYFHGDGVFCKGEVEVVRAKGLLLPKLDSLGIEHFREHGFMGADAVPTLEASFSAGGAALNRVVVPASGGVSSRLPRFAFVRIEHVSMGFFSGRAFDATVTTSLYCSDGFVVSNCRGCWVVVKRMRAS